MLNWTKFDSDGSICAKGKNDYYIILVRGVPEERPKDCIIELHVSPRELTFTEIKYKAPTEDVKLLSRLVVLGNLAPDISIVEAVKTMKETVLRRENENPYGSINSAYDIR